MNAVRALTVVLLTPFLAKAADWPQWLGPQRDGSTAEKVAPWKDDPKVLWRQPVGEGHSGPVVAGNRVFLHARVKDHNEEELIAFAADSGKELWRREYPRAPFTNPFGNGPRAAPAVSDGRVYSFGITGIFSCFEVEAGKLLWQVDTLDKFQAKNLLFGMSCSPLADGDRVLVNIGAKEASLVAFDKKSGEVAWKCLDDRASYASAGLIGSANSRLPVFLTAAHVVALRSADGQIQWQFPFADALQESSATPVQVGELVIVSSITNGSIGIRAVKKNGETSAEQAWKNPTLTSYFSTPVSVGKHLFMVTGSNPLTFKRPEASLHCVEAAAGKVLWTKQKIGQYHASLIRTGDDKLLMLDDAGNLMLLQPNSEKYEELARAKICGNTWAHPALANGRLYVRDARELICVQLGD